MNSNLLRSIGIVCFFSAGVAWGAPRGGMMGGEAGGMMGSGMPRAAKIGGAMEKVFGKHSAFSADIETQMSGASSMKVPGKLAFDQGKSRFEMDMSQAQGKEMDPQMASQMKAMGMDRMVMISRPDKKLTYTVYPGMEAYIETANEDASAEGKVDKYKVKTTELGKETVDGHPTIKNKVIVSEETNAVYQATVWNATDLKDFPIKIEQTNEGSIITTTFKNVKLEKPTADLFETPENYKKYNGMMEMMQEMVMKQMGGMEAPGKKRQKKQ